MGKGNSVAIFSVIVVIMIILIGGLTGLQQVMSELPEQYRSTADFLWMYVYGVAVIFVMIGAWAVYKRRV